MHIRPQKLLPANETKVTEYGPFAQIRLSKPVVCRFHTQILIDICRMTELEFHVESHDANHSFLLALSWLPPAFSSGLWH